MFTLWWNLSPAAEQIYPLKALILLIKIGMSAPLLYFKVGKMFQCLLMAEVKKESSVSCAVVLVCGTEGKRHSWAGCLWDVGTAQPLPGYKVRFPM